MRSSNPALKAFQNAQTWDQFSGRAPAASGAVEAAPDTMTVAGAVNRTLILLSITVAGAIAGWSIGESQAHLLPTLWTGTAVSTLAIWFILRFSPRMAAYLAVPYAILEGLFLGVISYVFENFMTSGAGIVFQALLLTFGIAGSLFLGYKFGLLRLGSTAKKVVGAGVGGVMFLYLGVFVLQWVFGMSNIPFLHEIFRIEGAGMIGIGFSAAVIVLASLLLVWDFQAIEEGAQAGAPRYMEWYAGYCVLTTIVWLYIEILHLLAKLRND